MEKPILVTSMSLDAVITTPDICPKRSMDDGSHRLNGQKFTSAGDHSVVTLDWRVSR
jgi:hypothetical protein